MTSGGGQEFGLRSGTENTPAIVGFAKAVEIAQAARKKESARTTKLKEYFLQGIKKTYPKAEVNGFSQLATRHFLLPIFSMFISQLTMRKIFSRDLISQASRHHRVRRVVHEPWKARMS